MPLKPMLTVAAAAAFSLGAAACSHNSAASTAPRCKIAHSSVVASDRYGSLLASPSSGGGRTFTACPVAGKPVVLGHSRCLPLRGGPAVAALRLKGPYVAYTSVRCGIDTLQADVRLLDLRHRRFVLAAPAVGPPAVPEGVQSVLTLELRPDGALAWVGTQHSLARRGNESRELWTADSRHKTQRLDSGNGIDPRSLHLSAQAVGWRNGSASRTASLR